MTQIKTAIGLMSGTSIDGIDVAMIRSDGQNILNREGFAFFPYDVEMKNKIRSLINNGPVNIQHIKEIELEITRCHIANVENFLADQKLKKEQIDLLGFHGHTILHNPQKSITWQIGNAQMLASATGIDTVADFRTKDIVFGGQGAPLVPIYHHFLFHSFDKPLLVVNIGGVSNITYLGNDKEEELIAFDSGFGNAPSDDLISNKTGDNFDENGKIAARGKVHYELADELLQDEYFHRKPPKSLDRNYFHVILNKISNLSLNDALATFAYIIGKTIAMSFAFLPLQPVRIVVCGGGRKNATIMRNIREVTKVDTISIDDLGINGDSIEAEAFAFLAIRHVKNLPISFIKTTGVLQEKHIAQTWSGQCLSSCGGVFYRA